MRPIRARVREMLDLKKNQSFSKEIRAHMHRTPMLSNAKVAESIYACAERPNV